MTIQEAYLRSLQKNEQNLVPMAGLSWIREGSCCCSTIPRPVS